MAAAEVIAHRLRGDHAAAPWPPLRITCRRAVTLQASRRGEVVSAVPYMPMHPKDDTTEASPQARG